MSHFNDLRITHLPGEQYLNPNGHGVRELRLELGTAVDPLGPDAELQLLLALAEWFEAAGRPVPAWLDTAMLELVELQQTKPFQMRMEGGGPTKG